MSVFRPFNYKDKPDIEKGAPQKHGFFVFWEIYFRKFWRFVSVNLVYFVVTLPILFYFYLTFNGYVAGLAGEEFLDILPGVGFFATVMAYMPQWLLTALLLLSVLLYGPLKMGATYIYRNFAREEHAWFSDLFSRALANWKQGVFFGVLDVLVIVFLLNNIVGSFVSSNATIALLLVVLKYLSIVLLVLYLFMRHYFYVLAVTVELGVLAIIKNSWLFSIMGLGRNLWSTIVCILVWGLSLFTYPLISVIALPLVTYSLCGFATVFTCYPIVKKYVVVPALERQRRQERENVGNEETPGSGE